MLLQLECCACTLLSLHRRSEERFHLDAQQSGIGRYTWRHQWQFSYLQRLKSRLFGMFTTLVPLDLSDKMCATCLQTNTKDIYY